MWYRLWYVSGYKEFIEVDVNAENVVLLDEERTVDSNGRISVGRDKSGESFEKIILVREEN